MASGPKLPYRFCPLPADGRRRLAFADLPARAYKVLLAILGLTLERLDGDGRRKTWTRATDRTLSEACGCCDRRVRRALVDLERLSWIERQDTGDRNTPREIRLGPALIDLWMSKRDEREMASGQQFFAWDRPSLPGPAKVLSAPKVNTYVEPLRKAVGCSEDFAIRTEVSALSGQYCPPLPYITENDHRTPPPRPQSPPDNRISAGFDPQDSEEDEGSAEFSAQKGPLKAQTPASDGHIVRGYGPVRGDQCEKDPPWGSAPESPQEAKRREMDGMLPSERLAVAERPAREAWATWVAAWDGLPPLPQDGERAQDLRTLVNDWERLGAEVLEAAIRHGRAERARGRFRLFDLRRYCAGLRSTCVTAGLEAVKRRTSARHVAAVTDGRQDWDARVKASARELRTADACLAYSESIQRAEAQLRAGGCANVLR